MMIRQPFCLAAVLASAALSLSLLSLLAPAPVQATAGDAAASLLLIPGGMELDPSAVDDGIVIASLPSSKKKHKQCT